jgi:hypothetical protein
MAEQIDADTWRVEVTTDRITADSTFGRRPSGSWKQTSGTLTVDGQERDPVSWAELKSLLDSYDGETVELYEITRPTDPSAAPRHLQDMYHSYAAKVGKERVGIGQDDTGRWIVAIDIVTDDNNTHLRFMQPAGVTGQDKVRPSDAIQLIVNGADRSKEAAKMNISKLMDLVFGRPDNDTGAPHPGAGPAPAKRNNSVQVRRATVRRV